jgi:SpoVK/Ycf46/Vps4 family AAA+-type ATPase
MSNRVIYKGGYYTLPQHPLYYDYYPVQQQRQQPISTMKSRGTQTVPDKVKQRITIVADIETLEDLIHLAEKTKTEFPIDTGIEYNIDMKMLNRVLPEMHALNNMIGQHELKNQIAHLILYQSLGLNKGDDLLHTVLYGAPGTGKTEFAQKIAKIYLKMGIVKKDIFKKVRRADLIAGFLGQTALKTTDVLDEVRGGVLFIDEAYSLGNGQGKDTGDSYSKECVDLLNQSLTEMRDRPEDYFILMIAGYKEDLENNFFSLNDGLARRFNIHLTMENYKPDELVAIFHKKISDSGWSILPDAINTDFIEKNKDYFKYNGGDMETLFAKCKIAHSRNIISGKTLNKRELCAEDILGGMKLFISNRSSSSSNTIESGDSWKRMYN